MTQSRNSIKSTTDIGIFIQRLLKFLGNEEAEKNIFA